MGILINKDLQQDSELRTRITAELREKQKRAGDDEGDGPNPPADYAKTVDGVDDSRYTENLKSTSGWVWLTVIVAIILIAVAVFLLAR